MTLLPMSWDTERRHGELEHVALVHFSTLPQHPACTGQLPGRTEMPRAGPPPAEAHSPEASAGTNALGWEAM